MRRRALFHILLLTACFLCGAQEITILPQFAVGDTLRYRASTRISFRYETDSLVSMIKMLPEVVVEGKNDIGFILKTSNKLESVEYVCSDPDAEREFIWPDKTDELNDFVAALTLRIQLGTDCRPDTILNMDEVKETLLNAYINMFQRESGGDVTGTAEWEMDTKPIIIAAINMIYTPKHLIEQQFGNLPYFNFIGIPLKSGKIPASMVLTDELQKMFHGLDELEMSVRQFVNNVELSISEDDGLYSIDINGENENTTIEGSLLYAGGILSHGYMKLSIEPEEERLTSSLIINGL